MRIVKRGIVIPDQHFPIHSQEAVNCVLRAIEIVKPDIFINLGDVGEWESVSPWKYKGNRKRPPLEYVLPEVEKEIKAVNEGLDQFDEACEKVVKLWDNGFTAIDIVKTFFLIIKKINIIPKKKINYIVNIAFTHLRILEEINSPIQLTSMIVKLCNNNNGIDFY